MAFIMFLITKSGFRKKYDRVSAFSADYILTTIDVYMGFDCFFKAFDTINHKINIVIIDLQKLNI